MLEGTTALVTGASQGIGRTISETLVERGANVTLAARSERIHAISDQLGDRALAVETDVTVNAICPGATKGPRLERVVEAQAEGTDRTVEEVKQDLFYEDAALGEMVDPEDIASMVAFLASEEAAHVTAQDLNVDAGTIWY